MNETSPNSKLPTWIHLMFPRLQEIPHLKLKDQFDAWSYLGPEGKNFATEFAGRTSFTEHIDAITSQIRLGIKNGWIDQAYIREIAPQLHSLRDAFDALKLQTKVEVNVVTPLDQLQPKISYNPGFDVDNLSLQMSALASTLGLTTAQGRYFLNDDGQSIIYHEPSERTIGSALTKGDLMSWLLASEKQDLISYFSTLYSLPEVNTEIMTKANALSNRIEKERTVIAKLNQISKPATATLPDLTSLATVPVVQGNSSGRLVTSENVDLLGTAGLAGCVAVVIYQDGKAGMIHIDDFSGKASLGNTGASEFLNKTLGIIKTDRDFDIHIIGGSQGGRKTVVSLYRYLEERGLTSYIKSFDALNADSPSKVTIDVSTGKLYPNEAIYDQKPRGPR